MKKFAFIMAFAMFATFSYAGVNSVSNSTVIENVEQDPKEEDVKKEEAEKEKRKCSAECKKECCHSKKKSCGK